MLFVLLILSIGGCALGSFSLWTLKKHNDAFDMLGEISKKEHEVFMKIISDITALEVRINDIELHDSELAERLKNQGHALFFIREILEGRSKNV